MISGKNKISLILTIPKKQALDRLKSSISIVKYFLLSPTFALNTNFVGNVDGDNFRIRKRNWYSNGLTKLLYGRIIDFDRGCLLEAEFKTLFLVVLLMRFLIGVFLILTVCKTIPLALYYFSTGYLQFCCLGAILFPVIMIFLILIELFARYLGNLDQKSISNFIHDLFRDVLIQK